MKRIVIFLFAIISFKTFSQVSVIGVTNASCYSMNNGSVTFSINGSAFPYVVTSSLGCNIGTVTVNTSTFTISNLFACSYTLTFVDNTSNTISVQNVNITQPSQLMAFGSTTNASCAMNNGCIDVFASGGVPGYTYSWSPGPLPPTPSICNLYAGTYSVLIVDGNGCQKVSSFTVTQPPGPNVSTVGITPAHCGNVNGSATISASGPGPITYSWSTTPVQTGSILSGQLSGNYTLLVTGSNSCTTNFTVFVPNHPSPTMTMNVIHPPCNSMLGTITVVSSAFPVSYSWTPVGNMSSSLACVAGTYTCTIKDFYDCETSSVVTVVEPPTQTFVLNQTDPSCGSCCDGSLAFATSGGTPPYSYTIDPGNITTTLNTVSNLCAGVYTVTMADNNYCLAIREATLAAIDGLEEQLSANAVTLTPNPAKDKLVVGGEEMICGRLKIYSYEGKLMYTQNIQEQIIHIHTEDYPSGIYLLEIVNDKGIHWHEKFMVLH